MKDPGCIQSCTACGSTQVSGTAVKRVLVVSRKSFSQAAIFLKIVKVLFFEKEYFRRKAIPIFLKVILTLSHQQTSQCTCVTQVETQIDWLFKEFLFTESRVMWID